MRIREDENRMIHSFQRIAYQALEVCNAVPMIRLEQAIAVTGLIAGSRMIDIGCGNGAVSVHMAERFGLDIDAVELDPVIAALAQDRIAASSARDHIRLTIDRSDAVLRRIPPVDLIVALGTTLPVGSDARTPEAMLAGLARHIVPQGWLLWGDLVWVSPPPEPLRQLVEINNAYASPDGWQAAAQAAGFRVVSARLSSQAEWDAYAEQSVCAVRDWLARNPDHDDAPGIASRTHQIELMFRFGHGIMGFGLYLLQRI